MKKLIAALVTALFLGSTGLALAEMTGAPVHHPHHHHKTALNPQPLPPRQAPPDANKAQ